MPSVDTRTASTQLTLAEYSYVSPSNTESASTQQQKSSYYCGGKTSTMHNAGGNDDSFIPYEKDTPLVV